MNEIMFRGKIAEGERKGEWIQGYVNVYDPARFGSVNPVWIKSSDALQPVVLETIGQFIGLLDKNGKRVFEGDILSVVTECDDFYGSYTETEIGVVTWYQSRCAYYIEYTMCVDDDGITRDVIERSEVIGNIYDNRELVPWYK